MCDIAVKQMLGYLLTFERRMGNRNDDNAAAQSAHDLFELVNKLEQYCPDEHTEKHGVQHGPVSKALYRHSCSTDLHEDLRDYNLVPLWRASRDLQDALIASRPRSEQMHWRAAFAFPKLISEPNWFLA